MLATDLADYLVSEKQMPFREAYGVVKELCAYASSEGKALGDLTLEEYRRFSPRFDEGAYRISAATSVAARDIEGGTAPRRVEEALRQARELLEKDGPVQAAAKASGETSS